MKKALQWGGIALIVLILGFYALNSYIYHEKQGEAQKVVVADVLTYTVPEGYFEREFDAEHFNRWPLLHRVEFLHEKYRRFKGEGAPSIFIDFIDNRAGRTALDWARTEGAAAFGFKQDASEVYRFADREGIRFQTPEGWSRYQGDLVVVPAGPYLLVIASFTLEDDGQAQAFETLLSELRFVTP